jgi:hypothetical protein
VYGFDTVKFQKSVLSFAIVVQSTVCVSTIGVGVGDGVGSGVGEGVGEGVAVGFEVRVEIGVGEGEGVGVVEGLGDEEVVGGGVGEDDGKLSVIYDAVMPPTMMIATNAMITIPVLPNRFRIVLRGFVPEFSFSVKSFPIFLHMCVDLKREVSIKSYET